MAQNPLREIKRIKHIQKMGEMENLTTTDTTKLLMDEFKCTHDSEYMHLVKQLCRIFDSNDNKTCVKNNMKSYREKCTAKVIKKSFKLADILQNEKKLLQIFKPPCIVQITSNGTAFVGYKCTFDPMLVIVFKIDIVTRFFNQQNIRYVQEMESSSDFLQHVKDLDMPCLFRHFEWMIKERAMKCNSSYIIDPRKFHRSISVTPSNFFAVSLYTEFSQDQNRIFPFDSEWFADIRSNERDLSTYRRWFDTFSLNMHAYARLICARGNHLGWSETSTHDGICWVNNGYCHYVDPASFELANID